MNDSSSQDVNSKLELLSNVYDGRILLVDRDYRIIKDTYGVDEGKTLISSMVIKCFKGEEASRYNNKTQKIEMAISGEESGGEAASGCYADQLFFQ